VYFLYLVVLFYCHFICLILYMFELNKWRWRAEIFSENRHAPSLTISRPNSA